MALNSILPQGPNRHCGNPELHVKHASVGEFVPVSATGERVQVGQAWCDGVPPLPPFVEVTVRVPIEQLGFIDADKVPHQLVLDELGRVGLGPVFSSIAYAMALIIRVRTSDGIDKIYPMLKKEKGLYQVVVDAPQPFGDVQP